MRLTQGTTASIVLHPANSLDSTYSPLLDPELQQLRARVTALWDVSYNIKSGGVQAFWTSVKNWQQKRQHWMK